MYKRQTFIIPDNVGGRFSVLTPVGLLPIAVAGFDINKLVAGAADMEKACDSDVPFAENPAAIYAATRNELYRNGKKIEILSLIHISWQCAGIKYYHRTGFYGSYPDFPRSDSLLLRGK